MLWLLLTVAVAQAPEAEGALRWSSTAEGAAVKTRGAAQELAETAGMIAQQGRLSHLALLRSQADVLVDRANLLVRVTEAEAPEPEAPQAPDAPEAPQ